MPDSPRNDLLRNLYIRQWSALQEVAAGGADISAPYLAWVHPDYEQADIKLVVVGKETNGWGERSLAGRVSSEAVDILMREYQDFQLGTHYRGRASFWTPVHELYRRLNPTGPTLGFVALNASVVDQDCSTPNADVRSALIRTGLLPEEIRILEPNVVVFHTGPEYETWLDGWFPGLNRVGDAWLARLAATGLPALSFRTYHPMYLNYRSERSAIYDRIEDAVHRGVKAADEA